MNHYEELLGLFEQISDDDKRRLICRFILKFSTKQIASIEQKKTNTITTAFTRAEAKLMKSKTHDEMISALQEIFCFKH